MSRRHVILVAAALLAASCGSDDATDIADAGPTTVPTTASPTTTSPTTTSPTTASPTTTSPTTTLPTGQLELTEVELDDFARFNQPIDAVVAPNGEWWLAERPGEILAVDPDTGVVDELVLDLTDSTQAGGERGLLGLAVDDEALYVNYTDAEGTTNVDAYLLDAAGRPDERFPLLTIEQPFSNHNGGSLAIGPDGHLYVGVGDGGSGGDPLDAGQDPDQVLGSIVRIDPTPGGEVPYLIPDDNPFADGGGVPEIFLTGVRNPWRFSFDGPTGDLWVADVGQNAWEEITLLLGANGWGVGTNLGWNRREGVESFEGGERPDANVDPVFVYGRGGSPSGCSITGGEVYRGEEIPELRGAYVFGDYCTADVWAISVATGSVVFHDLEAPLPGGELVDFATLPDGEMVAMSLGGAVVRIAPA